MQNGCLISLLCTALVVTLLVCLVACVSGETGSTGQTNPTEASSFPTDTTESTPPTDPPPSSETPTEPRIGWYEESGEKWYYSETGTMLTGWQEIDGLTYYFREDGTMAQGKVVIDDVNYFFTSAGQSILFVNPWNLLPEDYEPDLVDLPSSLSTSGGKVDRSCYDALVQMLTDCNKECPKVCVVSTYRTYDYQVKLFNRKVNFYLDKGYDKAEAEKLAATVIAIPGTSEHHTGLAVDIVDTRSWDLTEEQAELPAQKWLMENAWKYGFILRYPADKTDVTGIIYEPWHYRYVGKDVAAELHESGYTLEEYISSLTK